MSKLITIASVLAALAILSGTLPQVLHQVQIAKLHLIRESLASKWGRAMLLPVANQAKQ